MVSTEDWINLLKTLEPAFIEAGNLAREKQATIGHHNKFASGNPVIDLVTEADFFVQERIIQALLQTELREAQLLAEETTDLAGKFSSTADLTITVDPINFTKNYVDGGDDYSVVIGLRNKERPLYTFDYYPNRAWWIRSTDRVETSGAGPDFERIPENNKTIICVRTGTDRRFDLMAPQELLEQGYIFRSAADFEFPASKLLGFELGHFGGLLYKNPNVYDGLRSYHYALAAGCQVFTNQGTQLFDISHPQQDDYGWIYPGWYLVVRR